MIKDEGSSFETQLKIDFSPPNNGSKICLEKYLLVVAEQPYMEQIPSLKKKKKFKEVIFCVSKSILDCGNEIDMGLIMFYLYLNFI